MWELSRGHHRRYPILLVCGSLCLPHHSNLFYSMIDIHCLLAVEVLLDGESCTVRFSFVPVSSELTCVRSNMITCSSNFEGFLKTLKFFLNREVQS